MANEVNAVPGSASDPGDQPDAPVDFYNGFTQPGTNASSLTTIDQSAVDAAANYNDVIVYAGTDDSTANEGVDRTTWRSRVRRRN